MKGVDLLIRDHRYAEAALLLESAMAAIRSRNDEGELVQALGQLGICYFETRRLAEAREVLEEALALSRTAGNQDSISSALHELSMVVSALGETDKGIELCTESLDIELQSGGDAGMQMHTLAILYQEARRFEEAREVLRLVRESCEARNDLQGLGQCLNELGLVQMQLGDLGAAVKTMVDSVELKHRIGNVRGIQVTCDNLKVCLRTHPHALALPDVLRELKRLQGILG